MTTAEAWLSEKIITNAPQYYDELLADIAKADTSIIFNYYIFSYDKVGKLFVGALAKAAERGVYVRAIMDGIGSFDDAVLIAEKLTAEGVEVRIYHPLPWSFSSYPWTIKQGGIVDKFLHFIIRINRRDHRKFCVIDSKKAWLGSFNISHLHLPIVEGGEGWHDYGVQVTGSNVMYLIKSFDALWFRKRLADRLVNFRSHLTNISIKLRRLRNNVLLQRINQAGNCLWICSAYFSPTRAVMRAIIHAAKRDIDVCIIVAGKSDVALFPKLTAMYFPVLINAGVKVYQYEKSVLHAKLMLVDQQCVIGSTNLNHRSYYHDLEMDVVLSHRDSIDKIRQSLLSDMSESKRIIDLPKNPLLSRLLYMLRYWM